MDRRHRVLFTSLLGFTPKGPGPLRAEAPACLLSGGSSSCDGSSGNTESGVPGQSQQLQLQRLLRRPRLYQRRMPWLQDLQVLRHLRQRLCVVGPRMCLLTTSAAIAATTTAPTKTTTPAPTLFLCGCSGNRKGGFSGIGFPDLCGTCGGDFLFSALNFAHHHHHSGSVHHCCKSGNF